MSNFEQWVKLSNEHWVILSNCHLSNFELIIFYFNFTSFLRITNHLTQSLYLIIFVLKLLFNTSEYRRGDPYRQSIYLSK